MYKANNKIDELLEKNLNISYSKSESENSILSDKIDLAKTKNDKVLKEFEENLKKNFNKIININLNYNNSDNLKHIKHEEEHNIIEDIEPEIHHKDKEEESNLNIISTHKSKYTNETSCIENNQILPKNPPLPNKFNNSNFIKKNKRQNSVKAASIKSYSNKKKIPSTKSNTNNSLKLANNNSTNLLKLQSEINKLKSENFTLKELLRKEKMNRKNRGSISKNKSKNIENIETINQLKNIIEKQKKEIISLRNDNNMLVNKVKMKSNNKIKKNNKIEMYKEKYNILQGQLNDLKQKYTKLLKYLDKKNENELKKLKHN